METLQSPFLFDELIIEILSRLPVKSLLRFKCVSKSWKSLITDPSFVKLHLQNSPKDINSILLTLSDGDDRCFVPCSMHSFTENPSSTVSEVGRYQFNGDYWVVGSCNGLVCLRGSFSKYRIQDYWVLFWNPATRFQSKRSPSLSLDDDAVVFDFGFGYDNSSDTYKVVAVIGGAHGTSLKVYNMGDNCWRKVLISIPANFLFGMFNGQSVSGTLNSIAALYKCHADSDTITIERVVIFSVDIVKETFKQLLLPDDVKLDEKYFYATQLGVLRDSLCFFHDYKRTHLIIWQMKEFGVEKSWTQLVYVSYQHLQIQHGWPFPLLPLCISENSDVVIRASQGLQAAVLYNIRDNKVERTEMPNNKRCLDVKDYVESLVLPR